MGRGDKKTKLKVESEDVVSHETLILQGCGENQRVHLCVAWCCVTQLRKSLHYCL